MKIRKLNSHKARSAPRLPIAINNLGTIGEMDDEADRISIELEKQKSSKDDVVTDIDHQQVYSAKDHPDVDGYPSAEEAGD